MRLTAIVAAAALLIGFVTGWRIQGWRWEAADARRLAAQQETTKRQVKAADKASEGHEADKEQTRVEFRTIYRDVERIVERPVYRSICLDADGLRTLAAAVAGPGVAASQPAPAVPGPVDAH